MAAIDRCVGTVPPINPFGGTPNKGIKMSQTSRRSHIASVQGRTQDLFEALTMKAQCRADSNIAHAASLMKACAENGLVVGVVVIDPVTDDIAVAGTYLGGAAGLATMLVSGAYSVSVQWAENAARAERALRGLASTQPLQDDAADGS